MSRFKQAFVLLFAISVFSSCKKSSTSKNSETYIVSAAKLIDMTGNDWNNVEPQLSDKKSYWYTEFPADQPFGVKAAVSLVGNDEKDATIHCYVLLNVKRQTNKITSVSMSVDTTTTLNKDGAYTLMLRYFNESMEVQKDTSNNYASYGGDDGVQMRTTIDDVIDKLKNGFETSMLHISYYTNKGAFSLTVFKESDNTYLFNYGGTSF